MDVAISVVLDGPMPSGAVLFSHDCRVVPRPPVQLACACACDARLICLPSLEGVPLMDPRRAFSRPGGP